MTERKPKIQITVPPGLHDKAKAIADREGWTLAEFHRLCWTLGVLYYAEKDTILAKNIAEYLKTLE